MPFDNETVSSVYIKAQDGFLLVRNPEGGHKVTTRDGKEYRYDAHKRLHPVLILKITHEPRNAEKKMPAQWKIHLVDQKTRDKYILAMQVDNYSCQGLLNTIAAIEDYTKPLVLSAYEATNDKRKITRLSLSYVGAPDREYIKWKYDVSQIPKSEPVMRSDGTPLLDSNGFQVWDTKDKDLFFAKVVEDINARLAPVANHNELTNFPSAFPDTQVPETRDLRNVFPDTEDSYNIPF